jgi:hypothetical protein
MNIDQLVRDADPAALITIPDPPHVGAIVALASASQRLYRSRAIRARRRIPALAGGLTAALVAAAAAAALVLTGGPAAPGQHATLGHARTVVTTAWTVREDADGTVTITLRQYANPAGLQQTLRADGINAIVRAAPSITKAPCYYATANNAPPAVQRAAVTVVIQDLPAPRGGPIRVSTFIIHPHAMPPGSALFLAFATDTTPGALLPPGYPHVKAAAPIVLRNDTVPACVPVTKPGSTPGPTVK